MAQDSFKRFMKEYNSSNSGNTTDTDTDAEKTSLRFSASATSLNGGSSSKPRRSFLQKKDKASGSPDLQKKDKSNSSTELRNGIDISSFFGGGAKKESGSKKDKNLPITSTKPSLARVFSTPGKM
eukprot:Awhi_evm1s11813